MNFPSSSASSTKSLPTPFANLISAGSSCGTRIENRTSLPRKSSAGNGSVTGLCMWNYRWCLRIGLIDFPLNLASRGVTKCPINPHKKRNPITDRTEKTTASKSSLRMKAQMIVPQRHPSRTFMSKNTRLALNAHAAEQSAQTGAVNLTVWWRLKIPKNPYRYAEVSMYSATSEEPQREHSLGFRKFVMVVVVRYICRFLLTSNFQTNVRAHGAGGEGRSKEGRELP